MHTPQAQAPCICPMHMHGRMGHGSKLFESARCAGPPPQAVKSSGQFSGSIEGMRIGAGATAFTAADTERATI